ncbi:MAG: sulfate/molybdate ABC transporter ATP-binding protein [Clostridia bacterium]|nr:sulfate/molybdate ABC transporter ATP-binding protein [Clostridia bacterium]
MELLVDIRKKLPGFKLEARFETESGILGLLGASGSGKSMTLRCIAGLETPDEGRIVLNGRVLFDSGQGINLCSRNRKVGFLFQNYALFPHMTVEENIGFALKALTKQEIRQKVRDQIRTLHLEGLEYRYPSQLSGGQQQRVALARALAVNPEILLLDEPFSALDNYLRGQVERQLVEVLSGYHGAVVFVSHNMEEVYRVCSIVVILSEGKVAASGGKEQIFEKPPTLSAARLTGCKNIFSAKAVTPKCIKIEDWGCILHSDEPVSPNVSHVGIRAHHIGLAEDPGEINTFPCQVIDAREGPNTVTAYLKINDLGKSDHGYHLQWEISKEKWSEVALQSQPLLIRIKPENLIFMN